MDDHLRLGSINQFNWVHACTHVMWGDVLAGGGPFERAAHMADPWWHSVLSICVGVCVSVCMYVLCPKLIYDLTPARNAAGVCRFMCALVRRSRNCHAKLTNT